MAAANGQLSASGKKIPATIRPMKKIITPPRTAVAHGTTSRCRLRVMKRTAEEAAESTKAQSSSDPAWLPHSAVSLYSVGVVVEEWSATSATLRSVRRNAASRVIAVSNSRPKVA